MMKWLCLLLLTLNLLFFGWTLDRRTQETVTVRDNALRVPPDVPRLRLLRELPEAPPRRAAADAGTEDEPELVATLPGISTTLPESLITPMRLQTDACFSFGPFADDQRARQLRDWLERRDTQLRLRQESGDDERLLWVYLAPDSDAEATLDRLRASGIRDVSLIDRGTLQNAISLGLFSSQAAVNRRLRELQDKGYRPVVVPYHEGRPVYWVDARIVRSDTIDALTRTFPSGLNFLPVQCDKIALSGAVP